MMTAFRDFSLLCEEVQSTTKRLQKISLISDFLKTVNEAEIRITSLFFLGKVFPLHSPKTLSVSWRTIQKLLETLPPVNSKATSVSILDVQESFYEIADVSGKGSRKRINELLTNLFQRTDDFERKYLVRIIFGEMRIGVAEGLLLESIAAAAQVPMVLVRSANMYLGDPGEVAVLALLEGQAQLQEIQLTLFRPVQPMLAELAEDFTKVFKEHNNRTSLEFKVDGARVQIHKQGEKVRIYSRHLSDVTSSLPDLVELIYEKVKAETFVVDGEVLAIGKDGRPLPFQELMRRFRRVHDIETARQDVPIRLYLFDLLYFNGQSFIERVYSKRQQQLIEISDQDVLTPQIVAEDIEEAEAFLQKALDAGHEGLMAKKLDSDYAPGARRKKWFKIKPSETLDLVVTAAEWGSGRREGWLSNYHLAAVDKDSGEYMMLGKTFKGLTDVQFKWMTDKLLSLKTEETNYTVFVKPEVIVEVAYNEIQRSPHYNSKFALRFARIKRIREDKTPAQADSIERVRQMFEKQFERKGRA